MFLVDVTSFRKSYLEVLFQMGFTAKSARYSEHVVATWEGKTTFNILKAHKLVTMSSLALNCQLKGASISNVQI